MRNINQDSIELDGHYKNGRDHIYICTAIVLMKTSMEQKISIKERQLYQITNPINWVIPLW